MSTNEEILKEVRSSLKLDGIEIPTEDRLESMALHYACLYGKGDAAVNKLLKKNIDYISSSSSESQTHTILT